MAWHRNAELPGMDVWWRDSKGDLLDLTTASAMTLRVGLVGRPAVIEKTVGIATAEGSGTDPDGVPNVTITWLPGELDIEPGVYTAHLTAELPTDLDRVLTFKVHIMPVVEAAVV